MGLRWPQLPFATSTTTSTSVLPTTNMHKNGVGNRVCVLLRLRLMDGSVAALTTPVSLLVRGRCLAALLPCPIQSSAWTRLWVAKFCGHN